MPSDRPSTTRVSEAAADHRAATWLVIAGGGTIGHLTPGLAAAEELVERGCPREAISFLGSARGVEASRLPAAGWSVSLLPGRGLQRRPTPANFAAAWGVLRAVRQARQLLTRLQPAVVLATGGYASVPGVLAATAARIPVVVAEQNAVPGAANRLAMRLGARAVALSFDETPRPRPLLRWIPRPGTDDSRARKDRVRPAIVRRGRSRAVVTGNPVRPEVLAVDRVNGRRAARARLGVSDDCRLVLVFGGSLGARRLNQAALAARQLWRDRADLALRHVIGDRDWELFAPDCAPRPGEALRYQPVRYENAMAACFAAADLAVCRAGASTVAELTAVGLPAVLVPLPGAPGDHQTANARVLQRAGAAVLVPDAELNGDLMAATVDALLADPARLDAMSAASAALGRRDAARRVADLVEDVALRPRPGQSSPADPTIGRAPDGAGTRQKDANGGRSAPVSTMCSEESRP